MPKLETPPAERPLPRVDVLVYPTSGLYRLIEVLDTAHGALRIRVVYPDGRTRNLRLFDMDEAALNWSYH